MRSKLLSFSAISNRDEKGMSPLLKMGRYIVFPIMTQMLVFGGGFSIDVDLDSDGKRENISSEVFKTVEDYGSYSRLVVKDESGRVIWKAPRTEDIDNPFFMGDFEGDGANTPELAMDIDHDGKVELLVSIPACDISPRLYDIFEWRTNGFVPSSQDSILFSPALSASTRFEWRRDDIEGYRFFWVDSMKKSSTGSRYEVEASIIGFVDDKDGVSSIVKGTALIYMNRNGGEVKRWISGPLFGDGRPYPFAKGCSYRAKIGISDHFNSSGRRLKSLRAILRQDRANYHAGRGDARDTPESCFGTRSSRNSFDTAEIVAYGKKLEDMEKMVLEDNPLLDITYENGRFHISISDSE
jgi:hypothetical protein